MTLDRHWSLVVGKLLIFKPLWRRASSPGGIVERMDTGALGRFCVLKKGSIIARTGALAGERSVPTCLTLAADDDGTANDLQETFVTLRFALKVVPY